MIQYDLTLRDYLRIIRKRRFFIAACAILVTAVSWLHVLRQPSLYRSTTTVKIGERKTVAGLLTEFIMYNPGDIMRSHTQMIRGFTVLRRVADELGLIPAGATAEQINAVVYGLQGKIATSIVERTNIIEIAVTGGSPDEVVTLADAVARVFIEEDKKDKNKQAVTVRTFIEEQLADVEQRIRDGESRMRVYEEEVNDIRMSGPIQEKLVNLEFERVSLLQKYTDKHPRVKYIEQQIAELEEQMRGFSGRELDYSTLQRQVGVNKKLYGVLKEKLEEARISEAQKVGDITVVNAAVRPSRPISPQKEAGIVLGAVIGLVLGFVLAFVMESLDTSLGTVEDVETILKLPVLGMVPAVARIKHPPKTIFRRMFARFRSREKQSQDDERYIRLIVHYESKSSIAEAYRAIRTNVKPGTAVRTLLVTSAGPREGKTTVMTNLGLAIAQTGARTLLVSSDLRRPAVAKTFGMIEYPGLNEVLTGIHKLDECLRSISDIIVGNMPLDAIMETPGIENISILPSGHIPHNPAELLDTAMMAELMTQIRNRYDIVLFDSPPILPITDATLLAGRVDGVVLVYEAGRTSRSALQRVKVQLENAGANILGVVLNHINPEVEAASNFPYYYKYKYYKYGYYYGEPSSGKKRVQEPI